MSPYAAVLETISEECGVAFRAASSADLEKLRQLSLPESVVDFYAAHEPAEVVEGQVRLWPIAHILEENRGLIPGVYMCPHGFVVFATTYCGDAYCFDVSKVRSTGPGIVLVSHDMISEATTPEEMAGLAKPVSGNLLQFLESFVRDELDEDCLYG